jgi:cytochrome P450
VVGANPHPETGEVNLFDPGFARCPQPVYGQMHAQCPVSRQAFIGTPILARYEDVLWALRHPEIFSSEMELQLALGTERPMIPQQIDPPAQTRYRKLLDPHFSRKRMSALEPALRAQANALIDRFEADGRCDFDPAFAIPLPCSAFLSLLGLPQSDLELFLRLKNGIIRPGGDLRDPESMLRIRKESGRQIYAYFEEVIRDRRARPREDLMSELVRLEAGGERLSETELLDICFLMLLAGLDTVTATLGCNIAYLAANPEQRRRLVDEPALIPNAVEELLRWETPVTGVPRVVKRAVTVGGVELREGELVTLLLGASNVDAGEFPDAMRVDFDRERNRHLAFGGGPHRCLGSHLARMELRVALEEWHRRIPDYAIEPGATPRYSPGIREVLHLPLVWPA